VRNRSSVFILTLLCHERSTFSPRWCTFSLKYLSLVCQIPRTLRSPIPRRISTALFMIFIPNLNKYFHNEMLSQMLRLHSLLVSQEFDVRKTPSPGWEPLLPPQSVPVNPLVTPVLLSAPSAGPFHPVQSQQKGYIVQGGSACQPI